MAEIFISYAREDRETAERLARALEGCGWSVWWDRHIPAGRRFDEVIAGQLADADCVLALWSTDAIHSEWVVEEAESARERGVLVPALIEAVDPPLGFRRIHAADLIGWEGAADHAGFSQLVRDIDTVLLLRRGATARGTPVPLPGLGRVPPVEAGPIEVPAAQPARSAAPPPTAACDPLALRLIEQRLAQVIGPIARILVSRAAGEASDLPTLLDLVAQHVPSDTERARFLRDGIRLAHSPTADPVPKPAADVVQPSAPPAAGRLPIAEVSLSEIEKALARHIGPIAKVVVKRAMAQSCSPDELCASLLTHIEREDDRRQFRATVARLV